MPGKRITSSVLGTGRQQRTSCKRPVWRRRRSVRTVLRQASMQERSAAPAETHGADVTMLYQNQRWFGPLGWCVVPMLP